MAQSGNWQQTNSQGKVAGENSIKLWYYARFFDADGSGKCYIRIPEVSAFFERSPKQIKRWLNDGIKLGFFRNCKKILPGSYVVAYTSTLKVAQKLGLKKLGAIAQIPLEGLKDLRRYASKITALAIQRASEYRQQSKKACGIKLKIGDALQPSGIAAGGILFRTPRFLICRSDIQLVGGSQRGIAQSLNRAEITVQRHLSICLPIEKRQLAVASRDNWIEVTKNKLQHKQNLRLFKLEGLSVPCKAYTCVYHFPEIEPRPQKYLRLKLKRVLKKSQLITLTNQSTAVCVSVAGEEVAVKKHNSNLSMGNQDRRNSK